MGRNVRPVVAAIAMTIPIAMGLAGCGGGTNSEQAGACADPVPVDGKRLAALPFDLSGAGTVTEVGSADGNVKATAVTESAIDDSYTRLRGMLSSGGFKVTAGESEGVEAEIYFARGKDLAGSLKLVQGPCEGQSTIRLTTASPGAP